MAQTYAFPRPSPYSRAQNCIFHRYICSPDYCNSLFLNIDVTQINRQAIKNAITKKPRHHQIAPVLKTLHWLIIREQIEYEVISLTYNTLQSSQLSYLRQLFMIQPPRSTRSSSTLTLLFSSAI